MKACNFVAACLPSVHAHIKLALEEKPGFMNEESINGCLLSKVDKYLSSIGVVLTKKGYKVSNNMFDRYVKRKLNVFNSKPFLKNIELIVDSGGYQIQQGFLEKDEIPKFIDGYYDYFIDKYHNKYSYAFNLDLAPGSSWCPFDSYEEMEELNIYSFKKAQSLQTESKKKQIYVHHFRTPKILKAYRRALFKENLADGFDHFATGGLVSFSRIGDIPPYVMYMTPLLDVIYYLSNNKCNKFRFHVLGGAEWKEMVGHKFFEKHIKETLGIDIQITYDSSTFFRTSCLGKFIFRPLPNKVLRSVSIKPTDLSTPIDYRDGFIDEECRTKEKLFYELCNEASYKYGLPKINKQIEPIYGQKNTFSNVIYSYSLFHMLNVFKIVEGWCEEFVEENYPLYKDNKEFELINNIEEFMCKLSGGEKMNKRLVGIKAQAIFNSLHTIDEFKKSPEEVMKKCEYLIEKYMSGDECEKFSKDKHSLIADNSVIEQKQQKKVFGKYREDEIKRF